MLIFSLHFNDERKKTLVLTPSPWNFPFISFFNFDGFPQCWSVTSSSEPLSSLPGRSGAVMCNVTQSEIHLKETALRSASMFGLNKSVWTDDLHLDLGKSSKIHAR